MRRVQHQVYRKKIEIELLRKRLMDYTNIKHYTKTLNFLTRIPRDLLFQWILSLIRSDVPSILKSFAMDNHLVLILMKLKLGANNRNLSLRFNMKEQYVSKIFRIWLPKLTKVLAKPIFWPEREALRENLTVRLSSFENYV